MGARLSQPRGPAGTTEASGPTKAPPPPSPKRPFPRQINGRTIAAPLAAFTMACILFVYARTSIRAAKANAQRHRDADSGGEGISLMQEHLRRHGVEKRLDRGSNTIAELASEAKSQLLGRKEEYKKVGEGKSAQGRGPEEEKLRAMKGSRSRSSDG